MRESRCIGLAWALAVSMVMICATMEAAEAEKRGKQNVSERGGAVSEGPTKNRDAKPGKNADVVNEGNADQSVANRVDNPGKVTVIQSMVLEPPSEKHSFLSFDSGQFAYIEWTEGWVDESISPNNAREVGLELTSTLPGNAGQFPLQAHGNLQSSTGGGGAPAKPPEFHWVAKVNQSTDENLRSVAVREAFRRMWRNSNAGKPPYPEGAPWDPNKYAREQGGFVVRDANGKISVRESSSNAGNTSNLDIKQDDYFEDPETGRKYADQEMKEEILAAVHTHPNNDDRVPVSDADKQSAKDSGIPEYIINGLNDAWGVQKFDPALPEGDTNPLKIADASYVK